MAKTIYIILSMVLFTVMGFLWRVPFNSERFVGLNAVIKFGLIWMGVWGILILFS